MIEFQDEGKKYIIRPLEIHDALWFFDLVIKNERWLSQELDWFVFLKDEQSYQKLIKTLHGYLYGLFGKESLLGIGYLHQVDLFHNRAEIGGFVSREKLGRGLGRLAFRSFLQFLFETKNFHRLEIRLSFENQKTEKALLDSGFQREGHLRHSQRVNGKYRDQTVFSRISPNE